MPIPASVTDLNVTASLNSPQGTESAKGSIDDYFRAHASFIRKSYNLIAGATTTLPSASTVNIGFAETNNISITGTTTITAFDNYAEGTIRNVTFTGALTLTHNGTSLILPTGANISAKAGDSAVFKSLGSGNWKCLFYQNALLPERLSAFPASGVAPTYVGASSFTLAGDQTAEFHVGRRLQLTVAAGTVYGTIATSVYGALTTITLTMDAGQVLDAGLSAVNLSVLRNDHSALPSSAAKSGANTDITSLNAPSLGSATATTPPQFDTSTRAATMAALKQAGVQHSGPIVVGTTRALTAAEAIGNLVLISGNGAAITLTLPASSACPAGGTISFLNASGFDVTVQRAGADLINPATATQTTIILRPGDTLSLSLNGAVWQTFGGSAVSALGVGQTWQNVTGSRALSTTYTNTTSRPIAIMVYVTSTADAALSVTVNGVAVVAARNNVGGGGAIGSIIIPAGNTYSVSINVGTPALQGWFELR